MMIESEYHRSVVESVQPRLQYWDGAEAMLHSLTPSPKVLHVVLNRNWEQTPNLFLICKGVLYLKGTERWQDCRLRVRTEIVNKSSSLGFVVEDEVARFMVVCMGVEVQEDVEEW